MQNGTMNPRKKHAGMLEHGIYRLELDQSEPDEEYLERARVDLRETPETRAEGFKELRRLLQEEPDLYVPFDEEFLEMFLRPCKWYPKSAFNLMRRYYRFVSTHPRIYGNLSPSMEQTTLSSNLIFPIPVRTDAGCRVIVMSCGKQWNYKEVPMQGIFRLIVLFLQAAIQEKRTQISGVHVIFDMDGFSLGHVTAMSPSLAGQLAEWVQRCQPSRLKGIHIVNQPFIFNMGFAMFKPFILEKTRKRIHFHGTDRASLLRHLNAEAVPDTLGGKFIVPEEPVGPKLWDYFCQFEDLYLEGAQYGYKKEMNGHGKKSGN